MLLEQDKSLGKAVRTQYCSYAFRALFQNGAYGKTAAIRERKQTSGGEAHQKWPCKPRVDRCFEWKRVSRFLIKPEHAS